MSRTVTITILLAALAAGCAGTATPTPSPTPAPGRAEQVGHKFTVSGKGDSKYEVTLLSVSQPAQPDSEYSSAEAGHHLAAAQFRVTAITETDENSNLNATATGSNEQSYTPAVTKAVTAGTNFASGSIKLQPGSSLVGWVPFEIPDGVGVAKVHWNPAAGLGGQSAEWIVNSSAPAPGATPAPSPTAPSPNPAPPAPSPAPPGASPPGTASSPSAVVIAYFDAINARDYQKAWNLGGRNVGGSYSSFVSGFSTTRMVSVQILDLSGDIGTGVVTARVTSLETDGSTKVFRGMYTVRGGVITNFNVRQTS